MKEHFGHISNWNISMALDEMKSILANYNWLIVAIDSNRREHLQKTRRTVSELLQSKSAQFWWTDAGLWIRGQDIVKAVDASVLVHFSAVYIFGRNVEQCTIPEYSSTSESGAFQERIPLSLKSSLEKAGAKGYIADGCGLNYCFIDETLSTLIKQN